MDFKQIEAFVNVVKYKSFSKAADASFLTQPTISTHINTLEKKLNTKLIDRQGKEAVPTRQGEILFEYALSLLNTREKAVLALTSYSNKIDGVLEIQSSSIPGEYIVPDLIYEFKQKFPLVKFYIEQSDSDTVEQNLLKQKGEIGFIGYKGNNCLNYKKILSDKMVLITPKKDKYLKIRDKAVYMKDLIDEPFVLREQGSATRKEFEGNLLSMKYDPEKMNIVARFNSIEAIKRAVSVGLGVSIVPKIAVENDHDSCKFLSFEIKDLSLDREFYLAWNKTLILSPTAEAFKDYILNKRS
ncbi:MAG: LysR family transcriptional regulator [Clostridiales bacterium]|jgi:DNA-binding transcriptional LysR family regulator|nr:LysR family transcriptional regulator [Clostridiales bacterium]